MATDTQATSRALTPYRLTSRQYEAMCAAGVFGDDRVELLGGMLVAMTQYPPHIYTVIKLARDLYRFLPEDSWSVREEKPVRSGPRWLPVPDVAVARGSAESFLARIPMPADLVLLIEVSDTTYAKDRGWKWRSYAAACVPIYWIANMPKSQFEVYTDPAGSGKVAAYRQCQIYGRDDQVPLIVDGREVGRIAVKDILP